MTRTHTSIAQAALLALTSAVLALLALAPAASAKEAVDFFGNVPGSGAGAGQGGQFQGAEGVAVNDSGAGGVPAGTIYVVDSGNRIQRFGRDDKGTPGDTADDTYFFISAWGADVVQDGGTGDQGDAAAKNYEICTVAAECKAGVASGGNGTQAGNGALSFPNLASPGVAVDQDTGEVYVTDPGNARVNVYDGAGSFLRSFGFDVVASGPDETGTGYEICDFEANPADICKAGLPGAAVGQVSVSAAGIAVSPGTPGTVFLADTGNRRVNTYDLDGQNPASIGSAAVFQSDYPRHLAVDSRGVLYADNQLVGVADDKIERYDSEGVNGPVGFLAPLRSSISERQQLNRNATAGQFRLSFDPDGPGPDPAETTADIPYNAEASAVRAALEALPSIDAGDVRVGSCFCAAGYYRIDFTDALANTDVAQLVVSNGTTPLTGTIGVTTVEDGFGGGGVDETQAVRVAATAGTFTLSFDPDGAGPKAPETTQDIPYNWKVSDGGGSDGVVNSVTDALAALPSVPDSGGVSGVLSTGPGDATGSNPYRINFIQSLGARDVAQLTCDGANLSGGAGCSVTTVIPGQGGLIPSNSFFIGVDPGDGIDPSTDTLYAGIASGVIEQFGPLNAPGLSAPPSADDDRHATNRVYNNPNDIAVEPATGRLYVAAGGATTEAGSGIYVLDEIGLTPPTATLDSIDNVSSNSADVHASIDPNGPPVTRYHFEYVSDAAYQATGFNSAKSTPEVVLGAQETPQAVDATLDPAPFGLDPNTTYHVRTVAKRLFQAAVISNELSFTTDPVAPIAETTGTPLRTTTTANLLARVNPRGSATDYRFEYGDQGPCDANPCASTPVGSAGSGQGVKPIAEAVSGLSPDTTYHYRLIADNGSGGEVSGGDRSVTTRTTDNLPGQGSEYPGPPGSDRAWEQVNPPDIGGNPVTVGAGFSSDGNRAIYSITGGSPISITGSTLAFYLAQRDPEPHPTRGWQAMALSPERSELVGPFWTLTPLGAEDLSQTMFENSASDAAGESTTWRFGADGTDTQLFKATAPRETSNSFRASSADGERMAIIVRGGALDPAHPSAAAQWNLYDISQGADPELLSLLPGEQVPACGVTKKPVSTPLPFSLPFPHSRWLSADGGYVYFPSPGDACGSEPQLYLRDIAAGQTRLLSGPTVSGPACGAALIRSIDVAAFIWTKSRLDPADTEPAGCGESDADGDVYRYDIDTEALECVTCAAPGLAANVQASTEAAAVRIAVAEDGSRVYFSTTARLLEEASPGTGVYRVDVASGDLAYLGPIGANIGTAAAALTPDGTQLYFPSSSAALNPLGGSDNGGSNQLYRYDDTDRSLVCVSCPRDGSAALAAAGGLGGDDGAPNVTPVAADGTFAFSTPTGLVAADQNTQPAEPVRGTDVYEWRDGRLVLVTDGTTEWFSATPPVVNGVTPSGEDIFFVAAARYTPDAIDSFQRLYTARIGGGIDFPPERLPPCDLNTGACEGAATAPPSLSGAGSVVFEGPGNEPERTTPGPEACALLAQRTRKLAGAAKRLRLRARRTARLARRSSNPRRARSMRRKAHRFAAASRARAGLAKRQRIRAKRCRRGANRANSNRRAER